jgi:hypothetical protein
MVSETRCSGRRTRFGRGTGRQIFEYLPGEFRWELAHRRRQKLAMSGFTGDDRVYGKNFRGIVMGYSVAHVNPSQCNDERVANDFQPSCQGNCAKSVGVTVFNPGNPDNVTSSGVTWSG